VSVTREQAARIATLARLRFEDAELARLTDELNHILKHVEALQSLGKSLESLEKSTAPPPPEERASTRPPGAEQPDGLRDGIASFAPDWREGFFVVPPLPGVHAEDGQ
jgi:aspartyl-tRNA(Asn)/glutamyl-tRNA(Gln) amidotransferase subunit C